MSVERLLNYVAFATLIGAVFLGWQWPWGLLFLYWIVPAYLSGEAHLLGPVRRDEDPILYWAIIALWSLFGALMVLADLAPKFTTTYIL